MLQLAQVGVFAQSMVMVGLILTDTATIPILVVMGVISGTFVAFELPIRQTYLVDLVPPPDVASAASLHATAFNTTRFIGPGVAGVLIATVGIGAVFLTAALLALGVAVTVALSERSKPWARQASPSAKGIREAFVEGALFAARDPDIRTALLFVAAASILAIQSFQTLAPLFVSDVLGLQGGAYGAFMAAWGGGAVVAAYVVTLMAHGDRRGWMFGGASALAILLVLLSLTTSPPVAFVLAIVLGAGQIALVTNALVSVQHAVPDTYRGRVLGFYTTLYQGTFPIGALLAGTLATVAGVQAAMLIGGLALGGAILVARITSQPRARTA
jgi:predicted MFS family arabinose efflux permease